MIGMPLLAVGVTLTVITGVKSRNPVSLFASYSCPTLRIIYRSAGANRAPAGCFAGKRPEVLKQALAEANRSLKLY